MGRVSGRARGLDAAEVKRLAAGRAIDILADVAGIPRDVLDGKHHPCPWCGGTDRFRLLDRAAGAVFCSHCLSTKCGNFFGAVRRAKNCDFQTAIAVVADYLGIAPPQKNGKHASAKERAPAPSPATEAPAKEDAGDASAIERADADTRDRAYRMLLAGLSLTDGHRADLRRRGLSDEAIDAGGYRTYPAMMERVALAYALLRGVAREDRRRVPGLAHFRPAGPPGLMIPVRDVAGRIVSLRIRQDDADADGKYVYFSTGAPRAEAAVHVPSGIVGPCEVVRVTEGEPKAHVATVLSGVPTISVPGVGLWRAAGVLDTLAALGAKTVRVAYDADAASNAAVAGHLVELLDALASAGHTVELERWPPECGKGIDDVLAAGHADKIEVLAGEAAIEAARAMLAAAQGGGPAGNRRTIDGRRIINIDPSTIPVGKTLRSITDALVEGSNAFVRAGQLVVIDDDSPRPIIVEKEFIGMMSERVEFDFGDEKTAAYRPLPPLYAATWLHNRAEGSLLSRIALFTRNPVYDTNWGLSPPGYDASSCIYYAGPKIEPRDGTDRLDELIQDFCFRAPADRTNYLAMLLTSIFGPQFVGSKPAGLLNGNQPGLGKSILSQTSAILRDGRRTETITYNPNDEEFEKTLGAKVRSGITTLIIDNAKASGRSPRIESPCLERSITDSILSFRLLGQSATIRAENSHLFWITANASEVSRDLVTRSVVIDLYYEGDPSRRIFAIDDPEGYAIEHRLEILGELIGMVERWKTGGMRLAKTNSRFNKRGWGNIVGGILDACGEPDFLANAGEAAIALDETRRDFVELVYVLADHPQGTWTAGEIAELCNKNKLLAADLRGGTLRSRQTKMGTIAGRFVGESFGLPDGRTATFMKKDERKGAVYRVGIEETPNLPNLCRTSEIEGSAHLTL